jgi:hypothetical protein
VKVKKAACFKRGHCERAGQKNALWLQPGVGGRSTAACSYFLYCARAGQKMCFGSIRERGKEAQQPVLLFFTARAQDRNMRFGSSPFFFGSSRDWGKETQPLVLIFSLRACRTEKCALVPTGSGGEKHSRLFLFSPLRACRTKNVLWFQPRE